MSSLLPEEPSLSMASQCTSEWLEWYLESYSNLSLGQVSPQYKVSVSSHVKNGEYNSNLLRKVAVRNKVNTCKMLRTIPGT